MEVRDARPEDAPAIASVARASWHAAYDDLLGADVVDRTIDEWYGHKSLRDQVGTGAFLVAVADGEVVGFGQGGPDEDGDAYLPRLYVHPDHWGAGVGTRLLGTIAGRLLADGHERIALEVFAENDVGRTFYEGHGFEVVERTTETIGGREADILHMAAPLSSLADLD